MQVIAYSLYLVFGLSGIYLIKKSAEAIAICNIKFGSLVLTISTPLLLGVLFYGCSFLTFIYIARKYDISYSLPIISGLLNCAVMILGICMFSERLSVVKVVGAVLISIGVVLVGVSK